VGAISLNRFELTRGNTLKTVSIIIPALNEERFIGETLQWLEASIQTWKSGEPETSVEIIVVDNDSTDRTAELARSYDAKVVSEPVRNIARARNTGAKAASGEVLVFLDADTLVPPELLKRIAEEMGDPSCAGGAVAVQHLPTSKILRLYLWCWRIVGRLFDMAQGATQFYRRDRFEKMGGYDERIYMGEDVEFYWKMKKAVQQAQRRISYIKDIQVVPSARRYDQWPLWKTLLLTNPLVIAPLSRWQGVWRGWYQDVPR